MSAATEHPKPPPAVSERPKCPACDKPLRPVIVDESVRVALPGGGFTYERQNAHWTGDYRGYGSFCTLRCCEAFANAAFKAGYRIVR